MTVQVQIRALAGDRNVGGVTQPVLTNRQVQHDIRLAEGETNILGGIITDSEADLTEWNPGTEGYSDFEILLFAGTEDTRLNRNHHHADPAYPPHAEHPGGQYARAEYRF